MLALHVLCRKLLKVWEARKKTEGSNSDKWKCVLLWERHLVQVCRCCSEWPQPTRERGSEFRLSLWLQSLANTPHWRKQVMAYIFISHHSAGGSRLLVSTWSSPNNLRQLRCKPVGNNLFVFRTLCVCIHTYGILPARQGLQLLGHRTGPNIYC